jgi:uncharacterized protein YraI
MNASPQSRRVCGDALANRPQGTRFMRIALALAAMLAATLAAPTAAEAASTATARASGTIPLRQGPGARYATIAKLPNGTRVHLDYCTRDSEWCMVLIDGEPAGWARGSYLVGSAAKTQATPYRFLDLDPLHPLGFGWHDDDDDE